MTNTLERDIENLLEQKLRSKGYILDIGEANRNVYWQTPRSPEEKKKLKGLKPDFCIYLEKTRKTNSSPDIIIETKKPGMKLVATLDQAMNYATLLDAKIVIIFDGHTLKSFYVKTKESLKLDGLEINQILTIDEYRAYILNDTSNIETNTNIEIRSKQDLISVFSFANNKLRKAGITKGIERFTEFTNLLFLKLISEENDIITESIPEHIKWDSYKNKSGEELFSYINEVVIPELERIFNKHNQDSLFTKLLINDTLTLKQIIDKLSGLHLSKIETDIKGDAFEYFIQKYNSSNKDLGEYFTPRHIVNFLVKLANPKYGEKIYDPFCGTGGILISAFNYIRNYLSESNMLTLATIADLRENTIHGSEISSTAKVAKMNMILTGDGHSNIKQQNTLTHRHLDSFDVVLSNIPFNLEVDQSDLYFTKGKNGNAQCIEHILYALKKKPNARGYIIVPEGILNNSELLNTRKVLIDNSLLIGIISLPSGVFLPYADAKTSILVLQGFNGKNIQECFYYKVRNDGFTLTPRRRKKDGINDLDEFLSTSIDELPKMKYSDIVADKNYSLLYFKYDRTIPEGYIKLKEIIKEVRNKNQEECLTITISKNEFYGISLGEAYWGESFSSVTSESNTDYKIIKPGEIAYNPSRANIGSFGINLTKIPYAVSKMYVTFQIHNSEFLPEYVYLYLTSLEGLDEVKIRSFGAVRQALRFEDLVEISIPKISLLEQKKICERAKVQYESYLKAKNNLNNFSMFN